MYAVGPNGVKPQIINNDNNLNGAAVEIPGIEGIPGIFFKRWLKQSLSCL